jgi:nucleotide-binding universal stress UspA family protein
MHVTVGYLATPSGDDGVALAAALATTLDATVDVVLVLAGDDPPMEGSGPYRKILEAKAAGWLDAAVAQFPPSVTVASHTVYNESFAEGLIEFAEGNNSDMIVLGAAGDGILNRHAVGSVAGTLLHASPVPVALAPRGFRDRGVTEITGLTVAVPTRTSSANPLPFAMTLASAAEIPLRLMSLVSLEPGGYGPDGPSMSTRQKYVDAAGDNLDTAMRALPDTPGLESIVADGSTLEDAVSSLEWRAGDMLALGSGRLGQPSRVFLGSGAAKILKATTAPVVVVPRQFE